MRNAFDVRGLGLRGFHRPQKCSDKKQSTLRSMDARHFLFVQVFVLNDTGRVFIFSQTQTVMMICSDGNDDTQSPSPFLPGLSVRWMV